MRILLLGILVYACTNGLMGQEVLVPLTESHTIQQHAKYLTSLPKNKSAQSINLPFVDDFSQFHTYPDTALWLDNHVFVNGDMAVNPPTVGVATLDGLNAKGNAYNIGGGKGIADVLTSRPINMDFPLRDSIYLSFFYQPEGRVAKPGNSDVLAVEFLPEGDSIWERIWEVGGSALQPFQQVMIPVLDTMFLYDGFQFRFVSEGNLGGQFDAWHIDYVRLAQDRFISDVIIVDGAFYEGNIKFLNTYQQVPYKHFIAGQSVALRDSFQLTMTNLGNIINKYDYEAYIYDGTSLLASYAEAENIQPGGVYAPKFSLDFEFSTDLEEEKVYDLLATVKGIPDVNPVNDTLKYQLKFANYYAFDDGTAEKGYGITSYNGMVAFKFQNIIRDTLKSVGIHFAQVGSNTTGQPFRITIWEDENGEPGDILYQQEDVVYPEFTNNLNGFAMYDLLDELVLEGNYFVGWQQVQNTSLFVGYDMNNESEGRLYYNLGQGWVASTIGRGSIMLRPVFGNNTPIVSVKELNDDFDVKLYPNPTYGQLYVDGLRGEFDFQVFNLSGQRVFEGRTENVISLDQLDAGMYQLRLVQGDQSIMHKIAVIR